MEMAQDPRARLFALVLVLLPGCKDDYPEVMDYGRVCVTAVEEAGGHVLSVDASSQDCAGDHRGAMFECSITVEGTRALIETVFRDGDDPNLACAAPLEARCEAEVGPGTFTLAFADEEWELTVPSDDRVCIPGGGGGSGG